MTKISVDVAALSSAAGRLQSLQRASERAVDGVGGVARQIDVQIRATAAINAQLGSVGRVCAVQSAQLGQHASFLKHAAITYERSERAVVERSRGLSDKSPSLADRLRSAFAGLWKGLTSGSFVIDAELWASLLGGAALAWKVVGKVLSATNVMLKWVFTHVTLARLDSYLRTVGRAARNLPALATRQELWRSFLGRAAGLAMKAAKWAPMVTFAFAAYEEWKSTEGLPIALRFSRAAAVGGTVALVSIAGTALTGAAAAGTAVTGPGAVAITVVGLGLTYAAGEGAKMGAHEFMNVITGDPEKMRCDRARSVGDVSVAGSPACVTVSQASGVRPAIAGGGAGGGGR